MTKATMVIPSYWGRKKSEGWEKNDDVYDHPTPLDEEGTLLRLLESIEILDHKDFNLVILGVATAKDIQQEVENKLNSLIERLSSSVETYLFSYSHLEKIHRQLEKKDQDELIPLLKLSGYSNVRNLCLFLPHLFGSEAAVLIDDDEIFEDPLFMDKALEFIGQKKEEERILGIAGYYINPDGQYLLHRETETWMTYWNKFDSMNRAFREFIAEEPRLKVTPFAFGGNMVIRRDLFAKIPFDPSVPRGEDIDFLINARMYGYKIYLDNRLSIKHDPPPKSVPLWRRVREDVVRFVFEKTKLEAQEERPGMERISAEDLDPYPGEFLKDDLEERIFRSNMMLAMDYIRNTDQEGALECMRNIQVARDMATPEQNPFQNLCTLQKKWERLMQYFSSEKITGELISSLWP